MDSPALAGRGNALKTKPALRFLRSVALSGVLTSALVGPAAILAHAADTPSLGGGDCWRSGTPTTCAWNHAGIQGTSVYFRAIDQFSSSRPNYRTPADNAVNAWNAAPGPQFYHWASYPNDVWIYLNVSSTGNHGLTSSLAGITWLCPYPSGACESSLTQSIRFWYSNVYLNTSIVDCTCYSDADRQHLWAHESGHGMGLAHNVSPSLSLMTDNYSVVGPQVTDTGKYPGCSNSGFGTNCIYGWGD